MDINKFFSNIPIFIINLKDSLDRRNHILNAFKNYGHVTFIEAIDGRNKRDFEKKYEITYNSTLPFSTALIAVICSHIKAIHMAYINGLDRVCIFEDDVHTELIKKCNFRLEDVCNINQNWETIQLFYTQGLNENYNDYLKNGINLIKRKGNHSGSCYIINRKGMEKILTNVVTVDENYRKFKIIPSIIDPEQILFDFVDTYLINRPFVYYYFESQTFLNYLDIEDTSKSLCQKIHLNAKNLLFRLYSSS